jgi:diphthamide synthase (EF-2-diphthine--ammonia ligase)
MKFVALLSGGKDSVFSIEKCFEHGHELLCVANLYPPTDPDRSGDEINRCGNFGEVYKR